MRPALLNIYNAHLTANMKKILIFVLLGVIAVIAGLAAANFWANGPAPENANQRPTFTLPDTSGTLRNVQEWDGKLLLLNFWATWCAPCRKEIPLLIQAQKDHADQGLQIVGLAVDEPEPVREYAAKFNINYPLLVDAMNVVKLQDKLKGGSGLPVSILIDRNGNVRERVVGEMDQAQLDRLLAPYLPE